MRKVQNCNALTHKHTKDTIAFTFNEIKKIGRWHHFLKTSKRRVKQGISPIVVHPWEQLGCQEKQKIVRI